MTTELFTLANLKYEGGESDKNKDVEISGDE